MHDIDFMKTKMLKLSNYFSKILSASVLVLALCIGSIDVYAAPIGVSSNATERVIVVFKNKADKSLVEKQNGKVNREYKNISAISASVPKVALNGLKNNPNVMLVEQDYTIKVNAQTESWAITRTAAPTSWGYGYTGSGVKVAVVDTGIAVHEDLVVSGGAAFTTYTSSFADDNGHGTHVAGIIGAKNNTIGTVGIAPDVNLYSVKVLGNDGSGYLSDVVAGIDWSITNRMNIINLSLGSPTSSLALNQIVDKAYSQGILVVAAAGNSGTTDGLSDTVEYPARYNSVIAVSATDNQDNRASFSSTGSKVEVAAPGVNIVSTYLNNQYANMSGTSMATPYAVGNLALLKQAYPSLSATELRKTLQETIIDLGTSGKDTWFGYGLIQAPVLQQTTTTTPPVQDTVTPPAQEVVTQPQAMQTVTTLTATKTILRTGYNVSIKATVTDNTGKAITGAAVKAIITAPNGGKVNATGTTNANGQVTFTYTAKKTALRGTYNVAANATYSNYLSSTASTTFQF